MVENKVWIGLVIIAILLVSINKYGVAEVKDVEPSEQEEVFIEVGDKVHFSCGEEHLWCGWYSHAYPGFNGVDMILYWDLGHTEHCAPIPSSGYIQLPSHRIHNMTHEAFITSLC